MSADLATARREAEKALAAHDSRKYVYQGERLVAEALRALLAATTETAPELPEEVRALLVEADSHLSATLHRSSVYRATTGEALPTATEVQAWIDRARSALSVLVGGRL